jgi:secreted trypsin-like serine protease
MTKDSEMNLMRFLAKVSVPAFSLSLVGILSIHAKADIPSTVIYVENPGQIKTIDGTKYMSHEFCDYVVVGTRHLLTAGHCTDSLKEGMEVKSLSNDHKSSAILKIEKIIRHPNYKIGWNKEGTSVQDQISKMKFDIALIRLAQPISGYPIQIATLAKSEDEDITDGVTVDPESLEGVIDESRHISTSYETYAYRGSDGKVVHPGLFYVEYESGARGFCHGDSGGGLFVYKNKSPIVLAINSAMLNANKERCGDKKTALLSVPVKDNLDWIVPELSNDKN